MTAADYVTTLHRLAAEHQVSLIIPTVAEELQIVAPHADGPVAIVVGSVASAALAHDKWWTARTLESHDVAVPRYVRPSPGTAAEDLGNLLGWPFVTKPRVGRGGRGVRVHRAADVGDRRFPAEPPLIAQEFAPGAEYVVNVYRPWRRGRVTAVVLRKTDRTHGEIGNALTVERVDAPDVAALAVDAVTALDLCGPADLDIRRRLDGQALVLEVNARFGAHSAAAPEVLQGLLDEHDLRELVTA
ncbi:ATP-grasp domain-containing protein [Cryptosporangium japonicum]|uniref:ATP-grasp domain-containing protein n=1 Tax=Cryptosporangium japonicum TaxID=80872 RepID=UPI0031CFF801